jgi:hypothetical protein
MSDDLPAPLATAQARARTVPVYLRVPIIVAALALPFYWIVTDSGPYRAVANFQARIFDGSHYIMLSGGLTFIATLVPALVIVQLLAFAFRRRNG